MSESSFQKGLGGGRGLVPGICRALALISVLVLVGCSVQELGERIGYKKKPETKQSKPKTEDVKKTAVPSQPPPAQPPDAVVEEQSLPVIQPEPGSIKTAAADRLTLANYNRVKRGMVYEVVKNILGPAMHEAPPEGSGPGTILGTNSVSMSWTGDDKSITVTFRDGQVVDKAQTGLIGAGAAAAARAKRSRSADDASKQPPVRSPIVRTWTDAAGTFSTEAEFRGVAAGVVSLKKPDGTMLKLPLDKLSEEDRKWVEDRAKHRTAP